MASMEKIGLGGGCHWCTEAIFQSVKGIGKVEQGFVAPKGRNNNFSEAVIVHFDTSVISLKTLIEVHLNTHKSTSDHSMRRKYRSAVYAYSKEQTKEAETILAGLQKDFEQPLITKVYPFHSFEPSEEQFQNYYLKDPTKPFCEHYIRPKLKLLFDKFSDIRLENPSRPNP